MLIIGNGLGVHGSQAGDFHQTLNGYRGCQPIKLGLYQRARRSEPAG